MEAHEDPSCAMRTEIVRSCSYQKQVRKSSKNLVLYFKGFLKTGGMRLELKCGFSPEDGSVDYNVHTAIEFIEELFPIFTVFSLF